MYALVKFGQMRRPAAAAGGGDSDLAAWKAAVVANGGTVSAGRETIVGALITGLKTDGIFTKLDRLLLFAAENDTGRASARTSIVNPTTTAAIEVNSPTFTADLGYQFDQTTNYLDSGFNPTSAAGNYAQDSAHMSVWILSNRSAVGNADIGGRNPGIFAEVYPYTNDLGGSQFLGRINSDVSNTLSTAVGSSVGHFMMNRSASSNAQAYKNGSSIVTDTGTTSSGIPNLNIYIGANNQNGTAGSFSPDQIAMASIGGSLNSTEAGNLYTRLRTYMTAVGVP